MTWEGLSEDLESFAQHSLTEFNLKCSARQAKWGKTCGEKGYDPITKSYNHEFLEASIRGTIRVAMYTHLDHCQSGDYIP
jgi:hypothetical protein